jgi:8-oxo-dGTP pyrophosphatase MutT (NUDIX family)
MNKEKISAIELCKSPEKLIDHIQKKLQTHHHRQYIYTEIEWVDAAVLIPLFFKNNEAHLLFTKRTQFLKHHKGQISFPGGKTDVDDLDLEMTAIRETCEEIGLKKDDITLLGKTDDFLTNTHFLVQPHVGFFSYPYDFKLNPGEIDRLIEVPLAHLLDDGNFQTKFIDYKAHIWPIHYYNYSNDVIWGVTGFLLSNFLNIVFDTKKKLYIR